MNWNEEAKSWAVAHGMGSLALGPVEATKRQTVVMHAAKWQRSQLRADEAVERVAEALYYREHPPVGPRTAWKDLVVDWRDMYRGDARAAITALIGEEP